MSDYDYNAAAWQAASQSASTAASAIATSSTNRKTRAWNEKMMDKQRQWALDDWNRQNQYNSPTAQMQRLREAGLNPNLVYGNGATTTAGEIRSTDVKPWNPKAPNFESMGNSVMAYQDVRMREAQINNLAAQGEDIRESAMLKRAQRSKVEGDTEWINWKTNFEKSLEDISADIRSKNLHKLRVDIDYKTDENIRRELYTAQNLREGAERILNMKLGRELTQTQIDNINQLMKNSKLDEQLKQWEVELSKKGFHKGDPVYLRTGSAIINKLIDQFNATPTEQVFPNSQHNQPGSGKIPGSPKKNLKFR